MDPTKAAQDIPHFTLVDDMARAELMAKSGVDAGSPRGFGWRMLPRFKVVNGKRYQLHATRGWKCVGRAG